MKKTLHLILLVAVLALTVGCTSSDKPAENRQPQPTDTVYTQQAAMSIYGYQPKRALQIIDSAVIVGNLSEVWGDVNRARIYSQSLMAEQLDSLLGGPRGVRLDTARAIGERLLQHDSLKTNPKLHQDVLEILIYTARLQEDSVRWLQRSRELVEECRAALDPTMVGEVLSVIRQLAKEGMTMLIVTHEMKFARDVSTRIFFMYDGYIHEDGSPAQIFETPVHSATKAFIQRIRKEVFEIGGPDFDFLGMHSAIAAFCHKYGIDGKKETAERLTDQMLGGPMAQYRPITVRITHSEQSGVTALDFMVEQMQATPLSNAHRAALSNECRQVIEEPTKRGFRVKLII